MIDEDGYQRFVEGIARIRMGTIRELKQYSGTGREARGRQFLLIELAVRLMGDGGLRVGEVVGLTWYDVWINPAVVQCLALPGEICKGGRGREVPLSREIQHAIGRLRDFEGERWSILPERFVFHSKATGRALDVRQVRRWCERWGEIVIGIKIRPHDLRRLFGRRIRRIADVAVAQRLLGHRSLAHTDRYTSATEDECLRAVRQLNGGPHPTDLQNSQGASGPV